MGGVKTAIVAGALALGSAGLGAAQAPGSGQATGAQIDARFRMGAMEGVLEEAVQLGARRVRAQMQQAMPNVPDMLLISGAARARGFWLEGYGLFFDVEVPAMRKSIVWSVQMIEQNDRGVSGEIAALKRVLPTVQDAGARRELVAAVQRLEGQLGQTRGGPLAVNSPERTSGRAGMSPREDRPDILEDPGAVYTTQVKDALIDAMVDYSGPLPLAATDWLTVAARDQGARLQPGDSYDASTILVRIKGADLAAFRAGQLDRAETRRRADVREY